MFKFKKLAVVLFLNSFFMVCAQDRFGLWLDSDIEHQVMAGLISGEIKSSGESRDPYSFWRKHVQQPLLDQIGKHSDTSLDKIFLGVKDKFLRRGASCTAVKKWVKRQIGNLEIPDGEEDHLEAAYEAGGEHREAIDDDDNIPLLELAGIAPVAARRENRSAQATGASYSALASRSRSVPPAPGKDVWAKQAKIRAVRERVAMLDSSLSIDDVLLPKSTRDGLGDCSVCFEEEQTLCINPCPCNAAMSFCQKCFIDVTLKKIVVINCVESWREGVHSASIDLRLRIPRCPFCRQLYYPFKKQREAFLVKALSIEKRKAIVCAALTASLESKDEAFFETLKESNIVYRGLVIYDSHGKLLSPEVLALQIFELDPAMHEGIRRSMRYTHIWRRD